MAQALAVLGLVAIASAVATTRSQAQNATWNQSGTGVWNTPGNWTPTPPTDTVPPTGTATFGTSSQTDVTFAAAGSIGTLQFNSPGNGYFFNLSGGALDLTSASGGIVDNSAATITFSGGSIAGVGGITQNGTGTLILSGTDTYSGATTVSAGTLQVNGSLASAVTANGGGTLTGTGIMGAPATATTISNATLVPGTTGNPTGTLTVDGQLVLSTAADYRVTFEGGAIPSSSMNVSGTALVSGNLILAPAPGTANSYYLDDTFTIVSATQGVSHQFTDFVTSGSFGNLAPYLINNPNSVVVGFTAGTAWLGATATSGAYDWSTTTNWAGGAVPIGTASFGGLPNTAVTINTAESVLTLLFSSGVGSPYTFTINGGSSLTLSGFGILDNSAYPPQFTIGGATLGTGILNFQLTATAGDAVIVNNSSGTTIFGGLASDFDTASAGTANITNNSGGTTTFLDRTTGGFATITTNSGGTTNFATNSTAGNAILIVNTGGVVEFSGVGVVVPSSTGANSSSVSAGAIEGSGGQIELNLNTLTIEAGIPGTSFAGVVSGNGGLTIAGGTTTLTGANTYTGATTLNGGTLAVDGSGTIAASSGVTVNSGGTLAGTGTVPAVTVGAGGTLAPGASGAGTLTINGNLSLAAGADFADTINASTAGEASITGGSNKATLGGTFTAIAGGGSYAGPYTVLSTANGSGVSGTFSGLGVTGSFGNQVPYLIYNANNVQVGLTGGTVWTGAAPGNWNVAGNWTGGAIPTAGFTGGAANVATFTNAGTPNVTVNSTAAAGTMLFTSVAPAYTFTINSGNSLTLNGIGVVDNSGNAPTFNVGGTLTFQNAANAGDAILNVGGSGTVNFSGTAGATGNNAVTAGAIEGAGGAITLGANTLTVTAPAGTFSGTLGAVGDTGGFTVGGAGPQTFGTVTANYSGATTIDSGATLILSGVTTFAGSSTVVDNGALTLGVSNSIASLAGQGTVALGANTLTINNATSTFAGVISGGGGVSVTGGVQTLSGSNSYSGATNINGGTLVLGAANAIADSTAVNINGGTLGLGGYSQRLPATVSLSGGGTIEGGTLTSATTINSTGGTINTIGGSAAVTAASGTTTLAGNNTYAGPTTINPGAILAAAGANVFTSNSTLVAAATNVVNDNGTFDLGSNNQTIYALSGSGTVTNASNPLSLSGNNTPVLTVVGDHSTTFSGVISNGTLTSVTNTTGLTVAGGNLTLSGNMSGTAHAYTGPTTVAGGVLNVTGNISQSSVLNVTAGGNVLGVPVLSVLTGTGTVPAVNVYPGATLAPGSGGTGTLTIDGTLQQAGDYAAVLYANGTNTAVDVAAGYQALLGGVFTAVAGGGGPYSAATTYTVLSTTTANYVGGSFAAIDMVGSFGNLVPYLTVNVSNVTVGLTAGTLWIGGVSSNNWNAAGNWTGGVVPSESTSTDAVATFGAGAQTTVNITSAASANTLLFTSAATSQYTFNINSGGSLQLNGIGIDDNSGKPPTFNVGGPGNGTLQFVGAATVGDATINVASSGLVQFGNASNGGTAVFNNSGGTVDFSGTLGPAGSGVVTVGAIEGTGGNYELGANYLTITGAQSTTVGSIISDCAVGCIGNANGASGGVLVMAGSGTMTLSGANTYTGGTILSSGTVNVDSYTNYITAGTPTSGILNSPIGTGTLTFNGGTLQAGAPPAATAAVTFANGSSSIAWPGNGLPAGTPVVFTTTGSLPTNFTAGQIYWVVTAGTNIAVATTPGGTPIVAGSAGSGTWTGVAVLTVNNATQVTALGGTIDAHGQTFMLAGNITDNASYPGGTLTVIDSSGGGTVIFTGQNTYIGPTVVGDGTHVVTLQSDGPESFSGASAVTLKANATLDLDGYSQAIGGLSGSGTVIDSGQGTNVAATLVVDGGTGTFSGAINGSGIGTTGVLSLAVLGSGTVLTLSSANTYSGATIVGPGATLALSNSGIASSSGLIDDGTFDIHANGAGNNTIASLSGTNAGANVVLGANTLTISGGSTANPYYGAIGGTGGLTLGTGGAVALFGTSTYSGGTTIDNGATLQVGANGALGSSAVTIAGGTLQAGANNLTLNNNVTLTTLTDTFDSHGNTLTWTGAITGFGELNVTDSVGGGTLVLTNANDDLYTNVNSGNLQVNGSITSVLGVNVKSGATLSGTGTIDTALNVVVNSGGTLSPGSTGNPTGTLNITGNLTFASGSTYAVTLNGNSSSEAAVTGTATLTGATLSIGGTASSTSATILSASGGLGSTTFSAINITGNFGNSLPNVTYPTADTVVLNMISGIVWQGSTAAGGNVWGTGANWSGGQVPTGTATLATSVAAFDDTAKVTNVTISGPNTVGTILFNQDSPAFTLNIASASSLTLNGVGVVNESTATTPTFNVSGSMLFIDNSSGGNAQYNVASGGTLDFSGSSGNSQLSAGSIAGTGTINLGASALAVGGNNLSTTFGGVIEGAGGSLNKVGTGTLILSGANTYSGGTTITAGILQATNNSSIGTPGSGTLTLNGGTFQSNGKNLSFTNNVAVNAPGGTFDTYGNTLTWSPTATFSGTGPLTVTDSVGGGTLILANTGSYSGYTGALTVNAGTLEVDSNLSNASGMTVNGGTLSGTGTIGTATSSVTFNGGTLSPGSIANPIGTLTVNGNLTLSSASYYMLAITSSGNSKTNVPNGTVALNGATLLLSSTNNTVTVNTPYTIITAKAGTNVTGTLATQAAYASSVGPVQATVATTGNTVTTTFQHAQLSSASLPSGFGSFANAINAMSNSGNMSNNFVGLFNSPNASAPGLSGVSNSGSVPSLTAMQISFATTALNHSIGSDGSVPGGNGFGPALGFAPETPPTPDQQAAYDALTPHQPLDALMRSLNTPRNYSVWGSVYGGISKFTGDSATGSQTATTNGAGVASGIDYRWGPDTVVGFALGGGYTNWNLAGGLGGGNSEIFQAGFYGSHRFGNFYLSGAIAYALDEMNTNRDITSPSPANLTSSFAANGGTGRLETGYRFGVDEANLTPYLAGEFSALRLPSYAENTASGTPGFALSYAAQTVTNERAELGVWGNVAWAVGDDAQMRLGLKVGYAHDWWSDDSFNSSFLSLPTQSFAMTGVTPPTNTALASLLSAIRYANGISVELKLDGEKGLGGSAYSLAGTGTLRYSW